MHNYNGFLSLTLLAMLLFACTEVGENQGSNEITLNAAVLKGQVRLANVSVFNERGELIWSGTTDNLGKASIDLRASISGRVRISVQPTASARMLCDATQCQDSVSENVVDFGESLNVNEESLPPLATSVHLDDLQHRGVDGNSDDVQISALTYLTASLLERALVNNGDTSLSPQLHEEMAIRFSDLVIQSLGLDITRSINLLEQPLIDVNLNTDLEMQGTDQTTLSLVNAAFAQETALAENYDTALTDLANSPNDLIVQADFESIQKQVLREASAIAEIPELTGVDDSATGQIDDAARNPLDFDSLNETIEEATDPMPVQPDPNTPVIIASQASSSHWAPEVNNMRKGTFWWSSSNTGMANEWIQINFDQPISPAWISFGLNSSFLGQDLVLQGRNVGDAVWTDLSVSLSEFLQSNGQTDNKNVVQVLYPTLSSQLSETQFQFIRLLSRPSVGLLLEYLCVFDEQPDSLDCFTESPLKPNLVEVSSLLLGPDNIAVTATALDSDADVEPDMEPGWVSAMARNQAEWFAVEYSAEVAVRQIRFSIHALNAGPRVELQGLAESGWQTLIFFEQQMLLDNVDVEGFSNVTAELQPVAQYSTFRIFSDQTPFLWLKHWQFILEGG